MLRKRRNNLAEAVSTLVQQSEEEEAKVGVAAFLCQFFLYAGGVHTGRMPEICDCMQNRISKTMLTMLTLLTLLVGGCWLGGEDVDAMAAFAGGDDARVGELGGQAQLALGFASGEVGQF